MAIDLNPTTDRAGFPMVFVPDISAYIHWLPVTKIQLEYFLTSTSETMYGESWYRNILSFNPRVSPGNVNSGNYWHSLVSGILPADAKRFALWCGENYDLPTKDEWFSAYKYFHGETADTRYTQTVLDTPRMKPRTRTLIRNIEYSTGTLSFQLEDGRTVADQMLMRLGVMEFVYLNEQRNTYGGFGQTNSNFFGSLQTPSSGFPERLNNERDGAQMSHYGFRLIRRR